MHNFIPIVLIAVSIGLYFMGISPLYERVQVLRDDIAELEMKVPPPQELLDLRASLLSRYNALSPEDSERIEKFLPSSVNNVELILEITNIAARHNILFLNADTGTQKRPARQGLGPGEEDPYQTTTLILSLTGTYDNFRSFLADLERNLRIVDITALSFTHDERAGGSNRYDLTVQAYWKP